MYLFLFYTKYMTEIRLITPNKEQQKTTFEDLLLQSDKTLLYFYPKDNTPGCTIQATDFTLFNRHFAAYWIQIVWVSRDVEQSHCKFIEKYELNIPLIVDTGLSLHKKFWAWGEKNNYGKKVNWVIRSSYLVDKKWNILKEWKNVRAKWHVAKLMRELSIT